MKVLVINGPNLGRLGKREPEIYGTLTHDGLAEKCIKWGSEFGLQVEVLQSDAEAEIISWVLQAGDSKTPIILNAAAFTHYSYQIAQACKDAGTLIIEVHISNPHTREEFRHKSVISPVVKGTIAGFGINSYKLALFEIANQMR